MLSFKINSDRVFAYLSKYDLLLHDERFSILTEDEGICEVSFDISSIRDLSIINGKHKTDNVDAVRELLIKSIKESIFKKDYDEIIIEELLFLIFYIGFYKNISPELPSSPDTRLLNLAKLKKLVLKSGGLHNLKMEFKVDKKLNPSKKSTLRAEFNTLDSGYIYLSHFIKPLAKLLNLNISDKDDLLKNQLSEKEIDSIINKHQRRLKAKQKNIEAKGALVLGDFLKDNFDITSSDALLSYDQIRIIYNIYFKMGWQKEPYALDYIERFKRGVERNCL